MPAKFSLRMLQAHFRPQGLTSFRPFRLNVTDQSVIMTTASAHPIGKKRAIMDAARRLLVSHGYQDVTMDDVAHQAGVGKGTLFLYYKNKEQLLSAALADLSDQLRESLDGLAGSGKTGKAL